MRMCLERMGMRKRLLRKRRNRNRIRNLNNESGTQTQTSTKAIFTRERNHLVSKNPGDSINQTMRPNINEGKHHNHDIKQRIKNIRILRNMMGGPQLHRTMIKGSGSCQLRLWTRRSERERRSLIRSDWSRVEIGKRRIYRKGYRP
jgi:4-diphosphocytidyl-2C-methyl-D-erythritol kinase